MPYFSITGNSHLIYKDRSQKFRMLVQSITVLDILATYSIESHFTLITFHLCDYFVILGSNHKKALILINNKHGKI